MHIPKSSNPNVSESMLQKGLYGVVLCKGSTQFDAYIKKRHELTLVIDNTEKKLIVLCNDNKDILFEIEFDNIASAVCLDSIQRKENRNKFQITTITGEVYLFYAQTPALWDPLPFINTLNAQIDGRPHPEKHNADTLYLAIVLTVIVVFTVFFFKGFN